MTQYLDPEMAPELVQRAPLVVTDWNTSITQSGLVACDDTALNGPSTAYYRGIASMVSASDGIVLVVQLGSNALWYRRKVAGAWQTWFRVDQQLTQGQAETPDGTVFGQVSGLRLYQALTANLGDALAAVETYAIGDEIMARTGTGTTSLIVNHRDTRSGADLWLSDSQGSLGPQVAVGTWVCLGYTTNTDRAVMWRRIA